MTRSRTAKRNNGTDSGRNVYLTVCIEPESLKEINRLAELSEVGTSAKIRELLEYALLCLEDDGEIVR